MLTAFGGRQLFRQRQFLGFQGEPSVHQRARQGFDQRLAVAQALKRLGIEQRLALNAITDEVPDSLNEEQRQARGIVALPASLSQALECLRNSEALIEALPSALLGTWFALKTEELRLTEQLSPAELCEHYARLY